MPYSFLQAQNPKNYPQVQKIPPKEKIFSLAGTIISHVIQNCIHCYSFVSSHNLAGTFQCQYILLAFSISYFILLSLSLRLGLECFLFPSLILLNYKLLHSLQLFLVQLYLLKLALRYLLCLFALEADKLVKCSRIGKCLFYIITLL